MHEKLIYIIVLNYNGKHHLEYCLPTIQKTKYNNCKIILVDNKSSDDSIEFVESNFPNIKIIQTGSNLGWAGGNNIGIKYAIKKNADYVVLANNDIKVHPMWIQSAIQAFQSDKLVGFVGCTVFGAIRAEPLEKYINACKKWNDIKFDYTDNYIDGMALFCRTSVFKNIGMIDEVFFVYAEETDLQIRAKKAGYKRILTNVPIWHYSSGTFKNMKIRAAFLAIRNNIRLSIKHDNFFGILKGILYIYLVGCSPFFTGDMSNVTIYRLKPKGIFFNFFLISYCVLWNLLMLVNTLRQKTKDYKKIANTQIKLRNI